MSYQQFPGSQLVGMGWPTRTQLYSVIVAKSESGREVRLSNYTQSYYSWSIPFGYLNCNPNVAVADWATLLGFYDQMLGQYGPFLYDDPVDDDTSQFVNPATPTPSQIGTGDGVTTTFQLARTFGGSSKLIYYVNSTNRAPRIYINGTLDPSGYTISSTGLVTFGSAPSSGAVVAWDGQFFWLVRFANDAIETEQIVQQYFVVKKCEIVECFQ